MNLFSKLTPLVRDKLPSAETFSGYVKYAREHAVMLLLGGFAALLILLLFYGAFIQAPADFTDGVTRIKKGTTLSGAADLLHEARVIRSRAMFKALAVLLNGQDGVIAGDYFFVSKPGVISVAHRVTSGDYGLVPVRVTIPEGASVREIAEIFKKRFNIFDAERFLAFAEGKEGYLFPDTYFFLPNTDEETVLETLESAFYERVAPLEPDIKLFGKSLEEIIIMASIIEREAITPESRRIVSGILWKRIEIGMPLQVDVTFDYINGKNTFELTTADLADDSPYNTYVHKGLPPTPIANPGLDSIEAAIEPTTTNYLYFLADRRNVMHYSATFDEHKAKKARYLW